MNYGVKTLSAFNPFSISARFWDSFLESAYSFCLRNRMTMANISGHLSINSLFPLTILPPPTYQTWKRDSLTSGYFRSSPERKHCAWRLTALLSMCFLQELHSQGHRHPQLVIRSDVSGKGRPWIPIVDSPNCFRKFQTDTHSLYLGTLWLLYLVRDSIHHHYLIGGGLLNDAGGLWRQDAMSGHDRSCKHLSLSGSP